MKLSLAIRLGAMLRPQGFHVLGDGVGSCGWGAAYEAIGIEAVDAEAMPYSRLEQIDIAAGWGWTKRDSRTCPCCPVLLSADALIHHLNDDHHWTREAIADFIATLEPPEAPGEAVEALAEVVA